MLVTIGVVSLSMLTKKFAGEKLTSANNLTDFGKLAAGVTAFTMLVKYVKDKKFVPDDQFVPDEQNITVTIKMGFWTDVAFIIGAYYLLCETFKEAQQKAYELVCLDSVSQHGVVTDCERLREAYKQGYLDASEAHGGAPETKQETKINDGASG